MDGEVVVVAERAILTVLSLALGQASGIDPKSLPPTVRRFVHGPLARSATVFFAVALVVLSAPRVSRYALPAALVMSVLHYLAFRACLDPHSRFCVMPS